MKERILLCGGGGHAKTLIDLIRSLPAYELAGIADDALDLGREVLGVPVLGSTRDLVQLRASGIRCAVNAVGGIGAPEVRWRVFERIIDAGFSQPALVHPSAIVEPTVVLADGVQILANSYVSSASSVGFGSLLNAGVILSHDNHVGRCVNLSPGATCGGNVTIGDFTQIGMRATVNARVTVGSHAMIGNGATVKRDVPDGTRIYAGTIWPPRNRHEPDVTNRRIIAQLLQEN